MRISDWSSDVCSSDLGDVEADFRLFQPCPIDVGRCRKPASRRQPAPVGMPRRAALNRAVPEQRAAPRSEEHTSELQSLMRISYAVFCLKKKNKIRQQRQH